MARLELAWRELAQAAAMAGVGRQVAAGGGMITQAYVCLFARGSTSQNRAKLKLDELTSLCRHATTASLSQPGRKLQAGLMLTWASGTVYADGCSPYAVLAHPGALLLICSK